MELGKGGAEAGGEWWMLYQTPEKMRTDPMTLKMNIQHAEGPSDCHTREVSEEE